MKNVVSQTIIDEFTHRSKGEKIIPINAFHVNESFKVAIYRGSISDYDILIKYKQKLSNGKWSRIRTPKHIHWAVDILIKMHSDRHKTGDLLDFLINTWRETSPLESEKEREMLSLNNLLIDCNAQFHRFEKLGEKGEYSIKFLILLAKLLMIQEKTNLESAYMFGELLNALKEGKDIFGIVSIATHTGR